MRRRSRRSAACCSSLPADTVVAVGRRILPRPRRPKRPPSACGCCRAASHRVYTAVCLIAPKGRTSRRVVDTRVRFKRLSREDIESYLVSDEWRGKAGGYAIQGRAEVVRAAFSGSHSGVVGLPLYETITAAGGRLSGLLYLDERRPSGMTSADPPEAAPALPDLRQAIAAEVSPLLLGGAPISISAAGSAGDMR